MKILDLILLNRSKYNKLSDKKDRLYIGIILVGVLNSGILFADKFEYLFYRRPFQILFFNVTLALLYIILSGFAYTLIFVFPLFDIFKFFKREKNIEPGGFLVRFIKIYIITGFLTFPANILLYALTHRFIYQAYTGFSDMSFYIMLIILLWFTSAMTRGLDAICTFFPVFKRIVFISAATWYFMLTFVLGYAFDRLAFQLFK